MVLTAEDALEAYAEMINTLQISHFLPLLADDFHYASQSVLAEISSKDEFAEYMTAKLETLKRSSVETRAELSHWSAYGGGPCVVLSQDGHPICTAVVQVGAGKIDRIDLCMVPAPKQGFESGQKGSDKKRCARSVKEINRCEAPMPHRDRSFPSQIEFCSCGFYVAKLSRGEFLCRRSGTLRWLLNW